MSRRRIFTKWWVIFFVIFYIVWLALFIFHLPDLINRPDKFELHSEIIKTILFGILLYFNIDDYRQLLKNEKQKEDL